MSQNFAPYQDVSPDVTRSLSPPPRSPSPKTASPKPQAPRNIGTQAVLSPPSSPSYQNSHQPFNPAVEWENEGHDIESQAPQDQAGAFWSTRNNIDLYETSLGLRLDWEACLAYLGLPPAGAVVLLMFEHRSDYVRYARNSSFAPVLVRCWCLTLS
jgi:hypothetical protein